MIDAPRPRAVQRYFWLPVADESGDDYALRRHAFPGSRLDTATSATAYCGETFALAQPSEMDWIRARTCQPCNSALKRMKGWPQ
ncbi:zinc finger protein [Saccharopolyspora rosea]|uniref:Zinc finger protein n=1 Tax=Saccharopolyspora rosea TaxID=524884 RepID=A0ABW3FZW4_9PSEU|nr:zinc finger protein [Saccharopolyspora rosea]